MAAHLFKLFLSPERREVSNLRLECASELGGGVDHPDTKFSNRVGPAAQFGREFGDIGIEPDTEHRPLAGPSHT
jgi:hypothetical protein